MLVDSLNPLHHLDFLRLDQIQSVHRSIVGEQAFHLSLLMKRGYPVAPGLVISATALHRFLGTIDWPEPMFRDLPNSSLHLDVENFRQLQAVAQQIQQAIATTPLASDWLAALAERVGELQADVLIWQPSIALKRGLDLTLGDRTQGLLMPQIGRTDPESLAQCLRQAWGELFRARSLFYWQRSHTPLHQIQFAVLVQPLKRAIASGDLQISQDRLKIRSVRGLIQSLIRGEVTPDVQEIDLKTGEVLFQARGSKEYLYQPTPVPVQDGLNPTRSHPWSVIPTPAAQQQQFALQDAERQQLIAWAQQLATEMGHHLRVEWTIHEGVADVPSSLCLTQVWIQQATAPPPEISHTRHWSAAIQDCRPTSQQTLRGKAAAPGRVFAPLWVVPPGALSTEEIPPNVVVAAQFIPSQWAVHLSQVAGLIAEQGGMTSHAAILARELGIPAVVGVADATQRLQSGQVVCLDGDRGVVYTLSCPTATADEPLPSISVVSSQESVKRAPPVEPLLQPPGVTTATQLMVNLGRPASIDALRQLPLDGVGLLRSEHWLLDVLQTDGYRDPQDWQALTQAIGQRLRPVAEQFAPRPVFYRSLDLRSHEFRRLWGEPVTDIEANPLLGVHGVFRDRLQPQLFDAQLAALRHLQQTGLTNLRLLLPFVRSVEEFCFCRDRLQHVGLDQTPGFEVWIMAEVPAILFLLPDLVAAGVQGISIGTNDLSQLLLAIDRDHPQMSAAYDEAHPAVLRAIHHLINAAKQAGIPCAICGEAPALHPDIIPDLVRWGISSISVSPAAVEQTHRAIAQAEQELILEAARQVLHDS